MKQNLGLGNFISHGSQNTYRNFEHYLIKELSTRFSVKKFARFWLLWGFFILQDIHTTFTDDSKFIMLVSVSRHSVCRQSQQNKFWAFSKKIKSAMVGISVNFGRCLESILMLRNITSLEMWGGYIWAFYSLTHSSILLEFSGFFHDVSYGVSVGYILYVRWVKIMTLVTV